MHYMLEDVRSLVGNMLAGALEVIPFQSREWTVHGLRRREVVCDPTRLTETGDLCVVGFFGERRLGMDPRVLEDANEEVIAEFRNFPGIISYSSVEFADGDWANLVIHDVPASREQWRSSRPHTRAATELSPHHFQTVRIHNGLLSNGVRGGRAILIERTKYWAYEPDGTWQGCREFDPSAAAS